MISKLFVSPGDCSSEFYKRKEAKEREKKLKKEKGIAKGRERKLKKEKRS
jgi:hypothetical protein